jgi:hypothetical protein
MSETQNREDQEEELISLEAIYGEDCTVLDDRMGVDVRWPCPDHVWTHCHPL